MTMVVRHDPLSGEALDLDWWMGQVVHCSGGARDPKAWTLFQVADVDSGVIHWVNADLILEELMENTHESD